MFFADCNTPRSREAVYKCLRGQNPSLREFAIHTVPSLRMEKAVRALPELFDDQFVVAPGYRPGHMRTSGVSNPPTVEHDTTTPALRICDEAAEIFTKLVPPATLRWLDGKVAAAIHPQADAVVEGKQPELEVGRKAWCPDTPNQGAMK